MFRSSHRVADLDSILPSGAASSSTPSLDASYSIDTHDADEQLQLTRFAAATLLPESQRASQVRHQSAAEDDGDFDDEAEYHVQTRHDEGVTSTQPSSAEAALRQQSFHSTNRISPLLPPAIVAPALSTEHDEPVNDIRASYARTSSYDMMDAPAAFFANETPQPAASVSAISNSAMQSFIHRDEQEEKRTEEQDLIAHLTSSRRAISRHHSSTGGRLHHALFDFGSGASSADAFSQPLPSSYHAQGEDLLQTDQAREIGQELQRSEERKLRMSQRGGFEQLSILLRSDNHVAAAPLDPAPSHLDPFLLAPQAPCSSPPPSASVHASSVLPFLQPDMSRGASESTSTPETSVSVSASPEHRPHAPSIPTEDGAILTDGGLSVQIASPAAAAFPTLITITPAAGTSNRGSLRNSLPRGRKVNPLPPLQPLLPHERSVLPTMIAATHHHHPMTPQHIPRPVQTPAVQRADSLSMTRPTEQAPLTSPSQLPRVTPRLSLPTKGPTRQATMHQLGGGKLGAVPLDLIAPASPTDKPTTKFERQTSFDHTETPAGGVRNLERLDTRRTSLFLQPGMTLPLMQQSNSSSSSMSITHRLSYLFTSIIAPESVYLSYWRLAVMLVILYNAIVIPFRIAFDGLPYTKPGAQAMSYFFDHLGDVMLIIDILLTFRISYASHGITVNSPQMIRERYFHRWAVFDIVASLPYDLIQFNDMQIQPLYRLPKLLRMCKLIRDPSEYFSFIENIPSLHTRFIQLLKLPLLIFYASHLMACAWFGVSRYEGFGTSEWSVPEILGEGEESSLTFQYLRSLFWSMGIMSGRDYENSTPSTELESIVTFTAMSIGMIGLAYVIGNTAALVESANEKSKVFQVRVAFIQRFMLSHDISSILNEQVTRFFEYLWSRNKGFDLPMILAELPDVLTTDISMFLLQEIVLKVELFAGLDPGFIPALIKKMVPAVFLPSEFIVTYGSHGDSMYFLQQGEVDIIKGGSTNVQATQTVRNGTGGGGEDNEVILQTLKTGDRFGEYALVLPTQRTASARAVGFCTLYVLNRAPFEELMSIFTKSAEIIRARAKIHHDATLAREQRRTLHAQLDSKGNLLSPKASTPSDTTLEYEVETVSILLRNKDNAKEYRKRISVHAFRVDSPVVITKSWGISSCVAGDWLVIGGTSDAYTVDNKTFEQSYESIPNSTSQHMFRKKGTVLAVLCARPFSIKSTTTGDGELLTCKATDYLVQDDSHRQWFVSQATFEETYELCMEKIPPTQTLKKRNLLDANSAVIKALKGRQSSSSARSSSYDIDSSYIILPKSRFWKIWQCITLAVMLYNTFFLPFRIAFDMTSTNPAYIFFDYLGDCIMWADLLMHFRLAFVSDGLVVKEREKIREKYLRGTGSSDDDSDGSNGVGIGMFWYDLISLFPLDFFMFWTGMQPLFRIGRVLKIYSCYSISQEYIKNFSSGAGGLKLARMLFTFALFAHIESCIYFSFIYFEGYASGNGEETGGTESKRWLPDSTHYEHSSLLHKYLRAQYYSFVVLTGLGKMIAPNTNAEAIFSLLSILLGVVVVSFIVGEIASIVSNLDTFAVEHDKRILAMNEFMRNTKLPLDLQQRVRRFLDHQWSVQRGADPNRALNGLPPMLRLQMKMQICGDAIRRTPFFHQASDATLLAIVSAITFETYPPNEAIFLQGQVGDKMYIINRGMVEIVLPPSNTDSNIDNTGPITIKTIGKGSYFGEGAILKSGRRSASAICQKSADLMVLTRKDVLRIIQDDPEFETQMKQIMQQRLAVVNAQKKKKQQQRMTTITTAGLQAIPKRISTIKQAAVADQTRIDASPPTQNTPPLEQMPRTSSTSGGNKVGESGEDGVRRVTFAGESNTPPLQPESSTTPLQLPNIAPNHLLPGLNSIRGSQLGRTGSTSSNNTGAHSAPRRSFTFATTQRDVRDHHARREVVINPTVVDDEDEEEADSSDSESSSSSEDSNVRNGSNKSHRTNGSN